MSECICTGSFDPVTLGHMDVIERAAALFDRVWVCVSPNADKRSQMFSPEEKLALVRASVAALGSVEAELWAGLVADYAAKRNVRVIVRGVRNGADLDAEYQMAQINRGILPGLETLLLPASGAYQHFSSSMVREMIRYGQPLERYLPGAAIPLVRDMMNRRGDQLHG